MEEETYTARRTRKLAVLEEIDKLTTEARELDLRDRDSDKAGGWPAIAALQAWRIRVDGELRLLEYEHASAAPKKGR